MPAFARKQGSKWRVMEEAGGQAVIVKNEAGTAVDGGGHESKEKAEAQARALNVPPEKRRK